MNIIDCPHCGEQAISFARKMCLGPAISAKCKECGKKIGVPFKSMLGVIPFLIAYFCSEFVDPSELKIVIIILGFIVTSYYHMHLVPLEAR